MKKKRKESEGKGKKLLLWFQNCTCDNHEICSIYISKRQSAIKENFLGIYLYAKQTNKDIDAVIYFFLCSKQVLDRIYKTKCIYVFIKLYITLNVYIYIYNTYIHIYRIHIHMCNTYAFQEGRNRLKGLYELQHPA